MGSETKEICLFQLPWICFFLLFYVFYKYISSSYLLIPSCQDKQSKFLQTGRQHVKLPAAYGTESMTERQF